MQDENETKRLFTLVIEDSLGQTTFDPQVQGFSIAEVIALLEVVKDGFVKELKK